MSTKKYTGTVVAWYGDRGFGFVRAANGKNYFAHIRDWMSDNAPAIGQSVTFEAVPAEKGPKAVNLHLVTDIELGVDALSASPQEVRE